jgi:hypothetical protein
MTNRPRFRNLFALLATSTALGCATQPEPTGGGEGLPSANAGPFRALVKGEIGNLRSAPNGLTDSRGFGRDISVVDLDGKPETLEVAGFVAASLKEDGKDPEPDSPTKVIHRYGALDGRSFDREQLVVLEPDAAWEGGIVEGPCAVRVGDEIFLYYAAAGGIGVARGAADGMAFTKQQEPVLSVSTAGWDEGVAPRSPGVVRLKDGTFRLFYEAALPGGGTAIGEAKSADGLKFERVGSGPVLSPSVGATSETGDPPYDALAVGGPSPILATAGDGTPVLRVYYGAVDAQGTRTIGLAARYGDDGGLTRAIAPVFGTTKPRLSREPCVVAFDGFSFVYATAAAGTNDDDPAITVGLAPATFALSPPDPL